MKELMVMMAAMMPATDIAEELKNALQDFLLFPEDEEKKSLVLMHCNMFLLNHLSGGNVNGAKKVLDEMSSNEDKLRLFETSAS